MIKKNNIGIFIFNDVDILDFSGPYEVFHRTRISPGIDSRLDNDDAPFNVFTVSQTVKSIYETEFVDAPSNKEEKWMRIFSQNRYLKCRGENDVKRMKVYKICRWPGVCPLQDALVTDDGMYIGRVQINLNNGKKRKFLYFQTDYKIRQ